MQATSATELFVEKLEKLNETEDLSEIKKEFQGLYKEASGDEKGKLSESMLENGFRIKSRALLTEVYKQNAEYVIQRFDTVSENITLGKLDNWKCFLAWPSGKKSTKERKEQTLKVQEKILDACETFFKKETYNSNNKQHEAFFAELNINNLLLSVDGENKEAIGGKVEEAIFFVATYSASNVVLDTETLNLLVEKGFCEKNVWIIDFSKLSFDELRTPFDKTNMPMSRKCIFYAYIYQIPESEKGVAIEKKHFEFLNKTMESCNKNDTRRYNIYRSSIGTIIEYYDKVDQEGYYSKEEFLEAVKGFKYHKNIPDGVYTRYIDLLCKMDHNTDSIDSNSSVIAEKYLQLYAQSLRDNPDDHGYNAGLVYLIAKGFATKELCETYGVDIEKIKLNLEASKGSAFVGGNCERINTALEIVKGWNSVDVDESQDKSSSPSTPGLPGPTSSTTTQVEMNNLAAITDTKTKRTWGTTRHNSEVQQWTVEQGQQALQLPRQSRAV